LLAKLRIHRKSALDLIKGDIGRMRARLPAVERAKMDMQLESVRTLEREFDDRVPLCNATDPGYPAGRVDPFPTGHELQCKTIAAALACDQTRIVTLMGASGGGDTAGDISHLGDGGEWPTNYHSTGHASGGNDDGGGNDPTTRERSLEIMTRVSEFYAAQVSAFIDQLKAIPEGDGTVFDNTVVVWCTEMAHGNHGNGDWPWVIAGGKWHFTNGHFFNPTDAENIYENQYRFGNILIALAHAMGHPIESFGWDRYRHADPSRYGALWKV